jgi:peptide/nickel transport system substrate-binding protein
MLLESLLVLGAAVQAAGSPPARPAAAAVQTAVGPDLAPVDAFHPDNQPGPDGTRPPQPAPAWGGRVTVHTERLPQHLNAALSSSAYTRRILADVHAWLLRYDPRTLEVVPELATSYEVEDALVPKGGGGRVLGRVEERGDAWVLRTGGAERVIPKAQVESVERGTVFTFHLRDDVRWHDGHPFDAQDVVFSWSIYGNAAVNCDEKRWQMAKVLSAVALDAHTVRFVYEKQYFHALVTVGDLFLLPRHLYDPTDPDHEKADPEFHRARRAADPSWKPGPADVAVCVNENPHNRNFVGLGPYRVARWSDEALELERVPGWFEPARAGHVDTIRWRLVKDFGAAFRALLSGELDFDDALTTDDFLGSAIAGEEFTRRYYKGTHRAQAYWFVAWNTASPKLSDARVRRALACAADLEAWQQSYYRGLAQIMTGPFLPGTPACDPSIRPFPHDPARAEQLLLEAGWLDRDGDGVREKDGVALEIELLVQSGNAPALGFAAKYQEDLAHVGVKLKLQQLDQATIDERKLARRFEALALGWAVAPEADPEQTWHSRWAPADQKASNFVGLADPEVDRLIEQGQRELDPARRALVWRKLQARVFDLQPYLFCYAPLRKFALSRALRGFQEYRIDPNWSLRDLYYPAGTPGTRDRP